MKKKTLEEILVRLKRLDFKERFDIIVAIGRGGVAPANLISQELGIPVKTISINYRNDEHEIARKQPELQDIIGFDCAKKNILLVDDVVRSGTTIEFAKELLEEAQSVKTFAVNGQADYSLYDEDCFIFPW